MLRNLFAKKKNALGVLRVGLDGMVGMGKATVGFGGSCGKSSNYYLRSLFFVPFFFVLEIISASLCVSNLVVLFLPIIFCSNLLPTYNHQH